MMAFLKKYSPVENAFIDDFFGHVDPSAADDAPTVNLEFAARWLDVRKFNLMHTLKLSYTKGIDYTVSKPPSGIKGRGMSTHRIVMMTPDCFKTICMRSTSSQADRVRAYFLSVEKTLFRYRAEIVDAMQRRIQQLESNQRPLDSTLKQTGVIYVIRAADGVSRFKLGRSKDLMTRLRSHGSASADSLEVMFVYKTDDAVAVEACAMSVLKKHKYRKFKEVYEADIDTIKATIEGCGALVNKVQLPVKRNRRGNTSGGASHTNTFIIFTRDG